MKWCLTDSYDGPTFFMGYDMSKLKLDEFYMKINVSSSSSSSHHSGEDVHLYTMNRECFECPYVLTYFTDDTVYKTNTKFRIARDHRVYYPSEDVDDVICDIDYDFGQFGVYTVNHNDTGCYIETLKQPVNVYTPIVTVILIYLGLFLIMFGACNVWNKFGRSKWNSYFDKKDNKQEKPPEKTRIKSLDTFRGIVIVVMIFANFGNGGYEWFGHAIWNGLHVADLVFPSFMWIMGVCIPISLSSSFKRGIANRALVRNAFIRSVKLFCLGVFLTSGTDLGYLRILGVLQRFGIVYFIVSIICIFTIERSILINRTSMKKHFQDFAKLWRGWIIVLFLTIIHTFIIFFVNEPGCPKGYLGPGGLHKNRSYPDCIGGATGYIDRQILGNHAYQKPTIYEVYESKPFDPEGIVGCLTTILQVFIGVQAGVITLVYKTHTQRLLRWLVWAVVTGLLGAALCGFSKEHGLIPMNKNLWSLSFVLVTCSFAFFLLSLCYVLVDTKQWWTGKPFVFAGMNAILMYVGHEMTENNFPVRWYPHDLLGEPRRTHFITLLSDSWGAFVWVVISYYLYRINYFFTV